MALVVAAPGAAQQASVIWDSVATDPCSEPYSCVDDRLLSEAEAQSSRGYPDQPSQSRFADLLASLPTKEAADPLPAVRSPLTSE
jgi:hypothetical protein